MTRIRETTRGFKGEEGREKWRGEGERKGRREPQREEWWKEDLV